MLPQLLAAGAIGRRRPYPEGDVKLLSDVVAVPCKVASPFCRVVEDALSVVGDEYGDGVFILVEPQDGVDDHVVVDDGVVVVGKYLALLLREVGAVVVFGVEDAEVGGITLLEVGVKS